MNMFVINSALDFLDLISDFSCDRFPHNPQSILIVPIGLTSRKSWMIGMPSIFPLSPFLSFSEGVDQPLSFTFHFHQTSFTVSVI
jgi:hypothetical protein